ncbi:MAG: glycosyltransferase family 9 protein [Candidatus Acidiferrales bacterium]
MPDLRLLMVRLSSMGDIVHTLPSLAALRDAYPNAQIDWVVERKWAELLEGCTQLNTVIPQDRGLRPTLRLIGELRARRYDVALDFQGLYKSAALALVSGAKRRIGLDAAHAREPGAARFYNQRVSPQGAHVVEMNLSLARAAGATAVSPPQLSLPIAPAADAFLDLQLESRQLKDYYVISPGGGWRSKCWPAEQYGHLHRKLAERHGWRGVVTYGPGERALAEAVRLVAGEPEPFVLGTDIAQLKALLRRAKFLVAADSGPLHLAAALGTPLVGLYGPTDPKRNGPYGQLDYVVRNATDDQISYKRTGEYSPLMLSIKVEQVIAAIERRMGTENAER